MNMSEFEGMLPPATFDFLIGSFVMQAQVHMGLMRIPGEDEARVNLPLAKHAIDLLGVIEERTKGNLSLEEQRMLGNALTELRFRYVQTSSAQAVEIASGEAQ
jgi:hypothetical protein